MVAAIAQNIKSIEKLIKNGADPYRCPLSLSTKPVVESTEQTIFGNKTMIRK